MSKISQRLYYAGSVAFFCASTLFLFRATAWVDRFGFITYLVGSYCFILGTIASTRKRV